jgi:hypothetical protein
VLLHRNQALLQFHLAYDRDDFRLWARFHVNHLSLVVENYKDLPFWLARMSDRPLVKKSDRLLRTPQLIDLLL